MADAEGKWREAHAAIEHLHVSVAPPVSYPDIHTEIVEMAAILDTAVRAAFEEGVRWADDNDYREPKARPAWLPKEV